MAFHEELAKLLADKHITKKDFSKEINVSPSAINKYLKGTIPNAIIFGRICKFFGTQPERLLGDENWPATNVFNSDEEKQIVSSYKKLSGKEKQIADILLGLEWKEPQHSEDVTHHIDTGKLIEIGTYLTRVSAGLGNAASEDEKPEPCYYPATRVSQKADYCSIISGDSMEPDYQDGDILFVRSQKTLENGQYGIFLVNGEYFFKKYRIKDGRGILVSINSEKYEPIPIPENEEVVRGLVLGKYQKYGE